jgi:POT family proton-dependent oligopeptide transporter
MAVQSLFFPALMFLILGNGAFKPNISTQVGALYKPGDPRRDRAFSIFYVGINIGAFFSPLVCGTLGQMGRNTYHWGFAAAGVGMLIGLVVYLCGQRHLALANDASETTSSPSKIWQTVFGYIIFTPLLIGALMLIQASPWFVKGPIAALLLISAIWWLVGLPATERKPVVALCVLCFCTIFFWATYEQQGNTVQIWADKYTDLRIVKSADARPIRIGETGDEKPDEVAKLVADAKAHLEQGEILANAGPQYYAVKGAIVGQYQPLDAERAPLLKEIDADQKMSDHAAKVAIEKHLAEAVDLKAREDEKIKALQDQVDAIDGKIHGLMGLAMPSTWFQSINPLLIFTLTPFVTLLWARQARKKREPSTVIKMAIGCLLVGLSYGVLILAAGGTGGGYKSSLLWLFGFSIVVTLGELYLSPIGLSLVTKIAPARMVSMLMGVWFLATFVGNNMAGWIGTFFKMPKPAFWAIPALIAGATALLIFLLHKPVHDAIGGSEATADV